MPRGSSRLNRSAASIGRMLGQVAARVDAWKKQRGQIEAEVREVVEAGQRLLAQLGESASAAKKAGARAYRTGRKPGRRKGFKVSADTKRKLRQAWKRRKAAAAAAKAAATSK